MVSVFCFFFKNIGSGMRYWYQMIPKYWISVLDEQFHISLSLVMTFWILEKKVKKVSDHEYISQGHKPTIRCPTSVHKFNHTGETANGPELSLTFYVDSFFWPKTAIFLEKAIWPWPANLMGKMWNKQICARRQAFHRIQHHSNWLIIFPVIKKSKKNKK